MAQSFDCGKAQGAVERAICASPRLRQLDTDLASAYTATLRHPGAQTDAVRQAQRSWAGTRTACIAPAHQAGHPLDPEQCLAAAYTARIAALASPAAAQQLPVATPAQAAAVPAAAKPAPSSTPVPSQEATPRQTPSFVTPRPATGLPTIPAAAGTLERTRFPTAGETDVLLHVTSPGRFAIRATSATGTALQLVDMLTGPGDRQGWPGKQDGRIDALLDTGTYKVRAFGDAAATGETTLSLDGFVQPDPAQFAPGYQPVATTLDDLQVRSYWFAVGAGAGPVRIEAAGRSLAALALWRDGRELVDLPAETNLVNATPAHPMTDILLSGPLPPGTYLLTVYGGPKLSWTDGAADEPLYVRTGRSDQLLAGGTTGTVGVFGSETFDVPSDATQARLSLPQPATTELRATAAGVDPVILESVKNDRARAGLLTLPGRTAKDRALMLKAAPGQAYTLRPLTGGQVIARPGLNAVPVQPGHRWFGIQQPAAGGDEAPAAAMLLRFNVSVAGARNSVAQVLASPGVPAIGPGTAWRSRFNLRGETTLLFQVAAAVTVAVHADGPALTAHITTPEGAVMNAMGGGAVATSWSLSPGWYTLVLTPKPDAAGILDLTLGPPGLIPATPEPAGPEAPTLSLGEQTVDGQFAYALLANRVPDTPSVLTTRGVPIEIADFPLVETLPPGRPATQAVHTRLAGTLTVRDIASDLALERRTVAADAVTQVTLPAADHARTLAVALLPEVETASPAPAPLAALPVLQADDPVFLNLRQNENASFALTVGQGGLYQVQTTGRLKTAGRIGSDFIPDLGEADANGVGSNMLLQRYLRAGRYHLEVTAHDSAGRLGITAATTKLSEAADLLPGGSARATLAPGSGVAFPIRIDTGARYHLDLLGDGRQFSARLEDADGWPLRAAGTISAIDQDFTPGRYRLIVQPTSVEARAVVRLRGIEPTVALSGHGPHPLPFEAPQSLEWREPGSRDDPRTPDLWTFALAGPANVTLALTGDGMAAALENDSAKPDGADSRPLARLVAGTPLSIDLHAGQYRVAASSLGRNDRLAYTIALHSDALQPDVPRRTALPAELTFSLAEPRVVALTSFGSTPVRAALRDAEGTVLARAAGRTDDWNIAVSRRLPAGQYRLALTPLVPPDGARATNDGDQDNAGQADNQDDSQSSDQNDGSSGGMSNDSTDSQDSSSDQGNQTSDQDQSNQPASKPQGRTEVTLFLPSDQPDIALPSSGAITLTAGGVQHVTLPPAPSGSLLVAVAEAPVEIILALERRGADGTWLNVGQSQGLTPIIGVPIAAAEANAAWRLSTWTVDGGTLPIHLAARSVTATPAAIGSVALAPIPLDGITRHWFAAAVSDPGSLTLRSETPGAALLVSSTPGQPAEPPPNGMIAAQSDRIWLLSPEPGDVHLDVVSPSTDGTLAVAVPGGGRANLPAGTGPCAYVAASGLGQPGLQAGLGFGAASGSAFALCGGRTVSAWNAGDDAPLRLRLRRIALTPQPDVSVDQAFTGLLPPHGSLALHLPAGTKRIDASLAVGTALVAGTQPAETVTAWAGDAALSRSLTGNWTTITLVSTADAPAPVALTTTAVNAPWSLASGQVFRRFFGAAGSFSLPLIAQPGQRLLLAGATASVQRPDGHIRQGTAIPLDGPGEAEVAHRSGAVAMWIEGKGVSPWPNTPPQDVTLPQRLPLQTEAMALRLSPAAPVLLRLSSSAPVILAFGDDPPELFGQGAALARYLPAGQTVLRLLSPTDGPLSGTLELAGTPVIAVQEGLGAPIAVAPGSAAVFGFSVAAAGPIGLGVRADPDRVAVRLLDEHGGVLQTGVSMLQSLTPGHYLLEATVPPDAPTTLVRPAVLGTVPHPNPPPPEVIRGLLLAAGLTPPDSAR